MAQDINYIKSELTDIKNLIKEQSSKFDKALEDKANKWTEKAIYFAVAGIVAAAGALVWAITVKGVVVR